MTRRQLLAASVAAPLAAASPRTSMGVATTSFMTVRRPRETIEFLEYCHGLGAGGIQAGLSSVDPGYVRKLRIMAEQAGMYVEAMSGLPRTDDTSQFEATLAAASAAGSLCLRCACLGGRRYETFASLADWQKFVAESKTALRRAIPLAQKHRLPIALENHKDWTADEFVALLKEFESEWLRVCLDTGNNIALLDDPDELIDALAPYTVSTHIKDMGVAAHGDGFLLAEVPLGEGFIDLAGTIAKLRRLRPQTRFTLEMITRNPLQVPCLTDKYWSTFPDRNGRYLARILALVRDKAVSQPLPRIEHLPKEAQRRLEEDNVLQCLAYARERLGLAA